MMTRARTFAVLCAPVALLLLFAVSALGQCGGPTRVTYSEGINSRPAHLALVALQEKADERWGDERDEWGMEPIVGLWRINMKDPTTGYADSGYTAWHSDHTELFNSARAPATGSFCQGVWEKVGRSTYQLNHFAIGYNGTVSPKSDGTTAADETSPAILVHIRELVTVGPERKHFEGHFTVDIYTYTGHNQIASFAGKVTGERVTLHSPVSSQ